MTRLRTFVSRRSPQMATQHATTHPLQKIFMFIVFPVTA